MSVLAASFAPDGKHVAFLAGDSLDRPQVWTQQVRGGHERFRRTHAIDRARSRRVDARALDARRLGAPLRGGRQAAADGRARRIAGDDRIQRASERDAARAALAARATRRHERATFRRAPSSVSRCRPTERGSAPSRSASCGSFPSAGRPRAVTDVPFTARGLSWSPDGKEVAWSAGAFGEEDLFAADVNTGAKRQITALAGREAAATYSPDGRSIAFMHQKAEQPGALRIIDAHATSAVTDTLRARKVGAGGVDWTRRVDMYPQWSPASDALLVVVGSQGPTPPSARLVRLSGSTDTIAPFLDNPIFLRWNASAPDVRATRSALARHIRRARRARAASSTRRRCRAVCVDVERRQRSLHLHRRAASEIAVGCGATHRLADHVRAARRAAAPDQERAHCRRKGQCRNGAE